MNAGKITAALAASAAAALTVWLFTAVGETPERRGRASLAAGVRAPARGTLTGRTGAPVHQPAADSSGGFSGDPVLHRATPDRILTEPARPASRRPVRHPPAKTPVLPFAFREMPAGLHLEPAQTLAVEEVQDQFIDALGGEAPDPAAAEYREKWIDTQRHADLQLRARIGAQAFAAWQRQRSMKENAAGVNGTVLSP